MVNSGVITLKYDSKSLYVSCRRLDMLKGTKFMPWDLTSKEFNDLTNKHDMERYLK